MSPGPEDVQVSDAYLMKRIDDLGRGIENKMHEGFEKVERKFDNVVTQGEHKSTVARLETEINHVKEQVNDRLSHVEEKVEDGFKDQKAREVDRDKKNSQRMTWKISLGGIGLTLLSLILNHFL